MFIQLHFLTYLLLTTSQALRKRTVCPQPPYHLGGGSWPRVGNGPVDRLHNVWKMPLGGQWGCWEAGLEFPRWWDAGQGSRQRREWAGRRLGLGVGDGREGRAWRAGTRTFTGPEGVSEISGHHAGQDERLALLDQCSGCCLGVWGEGTRDPGQLWALGMGV